MFIYHAIMSCPMILMIATNYIEKKKETFHLNEPEYNRYGEGKWMESHVSLAKFRGIQVDTDYAEAYYVMRYLLE